MLLPEFDHEMNTTLKILNELSTDFFDFQPHQKSMTTQQLANHIAEIPTWVNGILDYSELDFESRPYKPLEFKTKKEVIAFFNKNVINAKKSLAIATNENMLSDWSLKKGNHVFFTLPKTAVIRSMVLSHIIHHRAQLGVYLRINDAKVPASYGDSADTKNEFS
tara:strand:- start:359898 stop:360389 length:492 start_codon:yes stop_codon:yes gene_type:complete